MNFVCTKNIIGSPKESPACSNSVNDIHAGSMYTLQCKVKFLWVDTDRQLWCTEYVLSTHTITDSGPCHHCHELAGYSFWKHLRHWDFFIIRSFSITCFVFQWIRMNVRSPPWLVEYFLMYCLSFQCRLNPNCTIFPPLNLFPCLFPKMDPM